MLDIAFQLGSIPTDEVVGLVDHHQSLAAAEHRQRAQLVEDRGKRDGRTGKRGAGKLGVVSRKHRRAKPCQGLPLEKGLVAKQHANGPWQVLRDVGQIVERFDGFRHASHYSPSSPGRKSSSADAESQRLGRTPIAVARRGLGRPPFRSCHTSAWRPAAGRYTGSFVQACQALSVGEGSVGKCCEICGKKRLWGTPSPSAARPSTWAASVRRSPAFRAAQFKPNLQTVHATVGKTNKTLRVCTQCIRSGAVTKRVRTAPFKLPSGSASKPAPAAS